MADADHTATLDPEKDYAVPESRVKNAGGIRARIAEMKQADSQGENSRSARRRKQQGIIDGNRPFSQKKLKETGQGDSANLNTREAEGMADAAKTPYYRLHFGLPRFLTITMRYGDNVQRNAKLSECVSNRAHTMFDCWEEHDYNVQLRDWEMCVHGVGLPVWEDEVNPFWESRLTGEVLIPDRAKSNINKLEEAGILRDLSPVDLYGWIKNEKTAKAQGWFPDRVKEAIVKAAPKSARDKWGANWGEEYQASLRRGDVMWDASDSSISVADYLRKEFSGKITHCIILDDNTPRKASSNKAKSILDEDDEGLLFRKVGRFDSFKNVICPFFFDIGRTGHWHSVKGLGPKIFDFCEVSNRLVSWMLNGARNDASLIMQAKDGTSIQETQLVHINGAVVLPAGYDVQQNRVVNDMRGTMAARGEMLKIVQSNTGSYVQRSPNEEFEPTLGQAQLNFQQQGQLADAARDRHMKSEDRLYTEMVRRAFKLGKRLYARKGDEAFAENSDAGMNWYEKLTYDFFAGCVVDGCPEAALDFKSVVMVKATRGIGNGSPVSMAMALDKMMPIIPMMPEAGRRHMQRLYSDFYVGQNNADMIFPPFEDGDVPDSNTWAAQMENCELARQMLFPITPTDDQDHVIHFQIHYKLGTFVLQSWQGGQIEPAMALMVLHNVGPHLKSHLDLIAGDPSREAQYKQMLQAWDMLSKYADKLQQEVEEAAKAEQPAPQPDPAMVAAIMKVQGELKLKETKMIGDLQLKAQKQTATLRMKDVQTAHSMRTQTLEAQKTEPELVTAA